MYYIMGGLVVVLLLLLVSFVLNARRASRLENTLEELQERLKHGSESGDNVSIFSDGAVSGSGVSGSMSGRSVTLRDSEGNEQSLDDAMASLAERIDAVSAAQQQSYENIMQDQQSLKHSISQLKTLLSSLPTSTMARAAANSSGNTFDEADSGATSSSSSSRERMSESDYIDEADNEFAAAVSADAMAARHRHGIFGAESGSKNSSFETTAANIAQMVANNKRPLEEPPATIGEHLAGVSGDDVADISASLASLKNKLHSLGDLGAVADDSVTISSGSSGRDPMNPLGMGNYGVSVPQSNHSYNGAGYDVQSRGSEGTLAPTPGLPATGTLDQTANERNEGVSEQSLTDSAASQKDTAAKSSASAAATATATATAAATAAEVASKPVVQNIVTSALEVPAIFATPAVHINSVTTISATDLVPEEEEESASASASASVAAVPEVDLTDASTALDLGVTNAESAAALAAVTGGPIKVDSATSANHVSLDEGAVGTEDLAVLAKVDSGDELLSITRASDFSGSVIDAANVVTAVSTDSIDGESQGFNPLDFVPDDGGIDGTPDYKVDAPTESDFAEANDELRFDALNSFTENFKKKQHAEAEAKAIAKDTKSQSHSQSQAHSQTGLTIDFVSSDSLDEVDGLKVSVNQEMSGGFTSSYKTNYIDSDSSLSSSSSSSSADGSENTSGPVVDMIYDEDYVRRQKNQKPNGIDIDTIEKAHTFIDAGVSLAEISAKTGLSEEELRLLYDVDENGKVKNVSELFSHEQGVADDGQDSTARESEKRSVPVHEIELDSGVSVSVGIVAPPDAEEHPSEEAEVAHSLSRKRRSKAKRNKKRKIEVVDPATALDTDEKQVIASMMQEKVDPFAHTMPTADDDDADEAEESDNATVDTKSEAQNHSAASNTADIHEEAQADAALREGTEFDLNLEAIDRLADSIIQENKQKDARRKKNKRARNSKAVVAPRANAAATTTVTASSSASAMNTGVGAANAAAAAAAASAVAVAVAAAGVDAASDDQAMLEAELQGYDAGLARIHNSRDAAQASRDIVHAVNDNLENNAEYIADLRSGIDSALDSEDDNVSLGHAAAQVQVPSRRSSSNAPAVMSAGTLSVARNRATIASDVAQARQRTQAGMGVEEIPPSPATLAAQRGAAAAARAVAMGPVSVERVGGIGGSERVSSYADSEDEIFSKAHAQAAASNRALLAAMAAGNPHALMAGRKRQSTGNGLSAMLSTSVPPQSNQLAQLEAAVAASAAAAAAEGYVRTPVQQAPEADASMSIGVSHPIDTGMVMSAKDIAAAQRAAAAAPLSAPLSAPLAAPMGATGAGAASGNRMTVDMALAQMSTPSGRRGAGAGTAAGTSIGGIGGRGRNRANFSAATAMNPGMSDLVQSAPMGLGSIDDELTAMSGFGEDEDPTAILNQVVNNGLNSVAALSQEQLDTLNELQMGVGFNRPENSASAISSPPQQHYANLQARNAYGIKR